MAVDTVAGVPADGSNAPKLTGWKNEPTLQLLTVDLENSKPAQQLQIGRINRWRDLIRVEGTAKPPKRKGRSSVQPKLIRRQAEWRYSALTEPFLGSEKLFRVSPVTFEDGEAAAQNELVLNYQFRTKLNRVKFIDDFVRTTVDEGTSILRVGWRRHTMKVTTEAPKYDHYELTNEEDAQAFKQALQMEQDDPRTFDEQTPPEIKAAIDYYHESGQATVAKQNGTEKVTTEKVIANHPTAEVMNPNNVFMDPACEGDLAKASFIVISFETSKGELLKEGKRYKNLDQVMWDGGVLSQPDHATNTPDQQTHDRIRRKVVAYEYWGFYDIHNTGDLVPIVVTWIGQTIIRMEVNPFPDQKLPFIVVNYMPVKRELYGEPDAELLEDQQAVAGALTRGLIDLMGRSANGQQGFAKGMLDPLNRRRFENGQDYEFNPNMPPQQGHIEHTYPTIPESAMMMLNLQNQEAEALTGVKSFGGGITGESYGQVAAGIRGVLDAAAKREMAILRRLAKGISELGHKIIAMNGVFLSDVETVRITNEKFVKIKREDLEGDFDLEVDISTAEVDNAKAQDLGFMLQTIGPNEDPEMRRMILSEIATLKRMPVLAHKIKTFQPQPDPFAEQMKQLQLQEQQKKIELLDSEINLNNAKANEASHKADKINLDTVEQETGTTHEREKEHIRAQARGNQDLAVTQALVKPVKEDEKKPDIEAAVGFNELADRLHRKLPDDPTTQVAPPAGGAVPAVPNSVDTASERNEVAPEDPRFSIGSKYYDPSLDPAANPAGQM